MREAVLRETPQVETRGQGADRDKGVTGGCGGRDAVGGDGLCRMVALVPWAALTSVRLERFLHVSRCGGMARNDRGGAGGTGAR